MPGQSEPDFHITVRGELRGGKPDHEARGQIVDSCLIEGEKTTMRDDLKPGNTFPDIELPNHDKETVTLSSLVRGFPTVLVFSRGYF